MNPVSVCVAVTVTPGTPRYCHQSPANELRGRLSPGESRGEQQAERNNTDNNTDTV